MLYVGMVPFPGHGVHWSAASFTQLYRTEQDMLAKKEVYGGHGPSDHFVQFH